MGAVAGLGVTGEPVGPIIGFIVGGLVGRFVGLVVTKESVGLELAVVIGEGVGHVSHTTLHASEALVPSLLSHTQRWAEFTPMKVQV